MEKAKVAGFSVKTAHPVADPESARADPETVLGSSLSSLELKTKLPVRRTTVTPRP